MAGIITERVGITATHQRIGYFRVIVDLDAGGSSRDVMSHLRQPNMVGRLRTLGLLSSSGIGFYLVHLE